MPWRGPEYRGELPTLGWGVLQWFAENLIVPDGASAGAPFECTREQAQFILNLYAVDPDFDGVPVRGSTFINARRVRRAILSRPKGWGKSPLLSALCLCEALGPVLLDGWDANGEPVAVTWRDMGFKPNVHINAVSEDQTANTWDPLLEMARNGPIIRNYDIEPMQSFINIPGGKIEQKTSSGTGREGGRPVFCVFDQALALDTPIPTPTGMTTMGALAAGDVVFGSRGEQVKVVEAKPVSFDHDCFRVEFSDGTSVVASEGHLWMSRIRGYPAQYAKVRSTGEMYYHRRVYDFRVPVAQPLDMPARDLSVHPYLVGLWLGDGTRAKCEISVSEADLPHVRENLRAVGVETWARRYEPNGEGYGYDPAVNLTFSRGTGYQGTNRPAVAIAMRELPCFTDKHIPDDYLNGSIEQRTAVLQGLMDSDGHCTKSGSCTFVSTNKALAEGVVHLLRSLGQVTSGAVWVEDDRYTGGGKYRVDFTPRGGLVPFRLPRKAERVRGHKRSPDWITISRIVPVPRVPVRCIAVDSEDHLFAAGPGFHLTHNTESWTRTNGGIKLAHTQRRNLTKMQGCSVETPNAFVPGEESIVEQSFEAFAAQEKRQIRGDEGGILLDHREAPPETDPENKDSLLAGFAVSYGDSADVNGGWVNLHRVLQDFWDPSTDPYDARRYFLNQVTHASDAWLVPVEWNARFNPNEALHDKDWITLGFDGSKKRQRGVTDSTALVACRVKDGFMAEIGMWEQPFGPAGETWEVPREEVHAAIRMCFQKYQVVGFFADPARWQDEVSAWEALYGRRVLVKATATHPIEWWMTGGRILAQVKATEALETAVRDGSMSHDGSYALTRHMLNARRNKTPQGDTIRKEHPDSAKKIDGAVAGILAYWARIQAVAQGLANRQTRRYARGF